MKISPEVLYIPAIDENGKLCWDRGAFGKDDPDKTHPKFLAPSDQRFVNLIKARRTFARIGRTPKLTQELGCRLDQEGSVRRALRVIEHDGFAYAATRSLVFSGYTKDRGIYDTSISAISQGVYYLSSPASRRAIEPGSDSDFVAADEAVLQMLLVNKTNQPSYPFQVMDQNNRQGSDRWQVITSAVSRDWVPMARLANPLPSPQPIIF